MPVAAYLSLLLVLAPPTLAATCLLYLLRQATSWGWRLLWLTGLLLMVQAGVGLARAGWEVGHYEAMGSPSQ